MNYHTIARFALIANLLAAAATTQGHFGPSVLALQESYHVGIYSATIDVPSGDLMLLAQQGDLDLTSGGALSGALDTWEWTMAGGTFTPNDPLAGVYHVSPDGFVHFDFDPNNPGNDLFELRIDDTGDTMHVARYELEPEALSVLAIRKSTGQSNAALNGTYHFYGQRMELTGASMEATSERGAMTFDGAGNVSFTGTELFAASSGTTSTSPITGTTTYSVAADGALVLDVSPGGISANGELLFVITGSQTSSEVGMLIGVRVGASYDHTDLVGLHSLHGQSHQLGTTPGLPRTITDLGELELDAATPTSGSWAVAGQTVDGNALGQYFGPLTGAGTTTLASNGIMTLTSALTTVELAFSASGKYAIGRVIENRTNLFFAMRQCPANSNYGNGTAGTGGIEPELGMRTFPTLGNPAWRYAIIDGVGGAAAIMPIGFAPATSGIPLAGGTLWLDPLAVAATPFVVLGGATGIAGAGAVDIPLAIPSHPSFGGVQLYAQALVLDPGAPAGVAMSRGFRVEFCR